MNLWETIKQMQFIIRLPFRKQLLATAGTISIASPNLVPAITKLMAFPHGALYSPWIIGRQQDIGHKTEILDP